MARGVLGRAPTHLASSVILVLRSARRLRAALPVRLATTLTRLLTRHVLRARRAFRARRSLRTRRWLATAAELARLGWPARRPTLRRVVLLRAHLVLLVHVRLRGASRFAVARTTVRCPTSEWSIIVSDRCVRRFAMTTASAGSVRVRIRTVPCARCAGSTARATVNRRATGAGAAVIRRASSAWRAIVAAYGPMTRITAPRSTSVECRSGTSRARSVRMRLATVPRASCAASVRVRIRTVPCARCAGSTASATVNRRASRGRRTIVAGYGPMARITAPRSTSMECRAGTSRARTVRVRIRTVPCARSTMITRMQIRATPRPTVLPTAVIRRASSPRFSYASARENTRPLSSRNARLAAVNRGAQIMVAERHVLVLALRRSEINMMVVLCNQFVSAWPRMQASLTTVEAHTVDRDVVDHRPVINVGDVSSAQVGNRPVVVERSTAPVTALEANATVPITVVDTTVETYVRAPISGVPQICAVAPTPVARRPQEPGRGCQHPGAGHPVIIAIVITPITWCPDIANRRTGRLHIYGQRRRREVDGDADRNEREGRHRQGRQRKTCQSGPGWSEAKRFLTHGDLVAIVV